MYQPSPIFIFVIYLSEKQSDIIPSGSPPPQKRLFRHLFAISYRYLFNRPINIKLKVQVV
jgi:hypothetical protein